MGSEGWFLEEPQPAESVTFLAGIQWLSQTHTNTERERERGRAREAVLTDSVILNCRGKAAEATRRVRLQLSLLAGKNTDLKLADCVFDSWIWRGTSSAPPWDSFAATCALLLVLLLSFQYASVCGYGQKRARCRGRRRAGGNLRLSGDLMKPYRPSCACFHRLGFRDAEPGPLSRISLQTLGFNDNAVRETWKH